MAEQSTFADKVDAVVSQRASHLAIVFLALVSPPIGYMLVDKVSEMTDMLNQFNLVVTPQLQEVRQDMKAVKQNIQNISEDVVVLQTSTAVIKSDVSWLKDGRRGQ